MEVTVLREAGYEEALYGISLSFKDRAISRDDWWTQERLMKTSARALALSVKDGGHNKFLESVVVWLDISMPRYFWQEFDTYRVGVTKQSEGTMHTLSRRPLEQSDFEHSLPEEYLAVLNTVLYMYNAHSKIEDFVMLKAMLPEGYLQRRVVQLNYKALRNIILQRKHHRLPHWQYFIQQVLDGVEHPDLLPWRDGPDN